MLLHYLFTLLISLVCVLVRDVFVPGFGAPFRAHSVYVHFYDVSATAAGVC